ncbi:monovalent cation/H(+) antiporter subunit G [Rubripirellula amarantea]|uniref:Na(+)/H(+) antiporter subunit G n=1 Tax=Rubripirellula amarantea TaxID=2527999 RepID=A0A5C5WEH2_9BACT|nr:monovalent cation/H(+) antiporter subunit G [Rubripirellula amarantea]MDA8743444.1 monovalent cation/H(+) antiporter subunit G [Rubripirellula amarantea]TWT48132.1 Na(+)/H(+) antiporter subunit G [Rubripirellula amarantea]
MMGLEFFQWACWILGGGLLIAGSVFSIIGGIGICRLPDFYSRMHGAGITDTMGAGLILIGLVFKAGLISLVAFKLLVILFFLLVTSPSACHALAHSAIASGLRPQLDVRRDEESNEVETAK